MFVVKSDVLNLRGVSNFKSNKSGNVYYILNVENYEGVPHQLYCPDASILPEGLKRGSDVFVTFEVRKYKSEDRLIVVGLEEVK